MGASVNRRPLLAVLIAHWFSVFGNTMTFLSIPWFVLETTGSASRTGIVVAMGSVAMVVVGLVGGAVVDRLGFKRTSVISDLASGLTLIMIPTLHLTVGIAFWQLLVLVFLGAVLDMPGVTARRSLYPDVAALAGFRLERANAGYQLVNRIAMLVGPMAAGVLVVAVGASNVLWATAVTFAISACVIYIGVPATTAQARAEDTKPDSRYFQEVREGFQFMWRDRTLFWMIVLLSVGSLIAEPLYSVIIPVYANTVLGSAVGLGIAFAGLAAGSILGNLIYAWRGYLLPRRALFVGGFAARAAAFWLLVTEPSAAILAVILFISGVVLEPVNPLVQTVMQERVPARMRGRVFSAAAAVGVATMPLGMIGYGLLLDWAGIRTTLIFLASINLILPVLMFLNRPLRGLSREPVPAEVVVS